MEIATTILIIAGVLVALWILVSFISFILILAAGSKLAKITKSHDEAFNDINRRNR